MGDIVIAYARPDEDAAALVVSKLKALGFSVKSTEIGAPPRHRRGGAAPHVVLWSKHAAAAYASAIMPARGPLLAARLDTAPLSRRLKTDAVDLRAWRGRDDHRGWRALLADVRSVADAPANAKAAVKAAQPKRKKGGFAAMVWLTALAAAAGGGAWLYLTMVP